MADAGGIVALATGIATFGSIYAFGLKRTLGVFLLIAIGAGVWHAWFGHLP